MFPMAQDSALNVVMFSAEAVPYVKVGGLADVVGALSRVLELQGVKVLLMLPAYQSIRHNRMMWGKPPICGPPTLCERNQSTVR